eukprot:6200913-Pleurochrysis_carterae.AAC.2
MLQPQKEGLDDLGFETSAFETLEHDFQEVLAELVGDKSLERFRQEYEKLHRALKKSHESEKRLIKKCRELNSEIVSNAAKVQTALKLSQGDQNTIGSLKRVRRTPLSQSAALRGAHCANNPGDVFWPLSVLCLRGPHTGQAVLRLY